MVPKRSNWQRFIKVLNRHLDPWHLPWPQQSNHYTKHSCLWLCTIQFNVVEGKKSTSVVVVETVIFDLWALTATLTLKTANHFFPWHSCPWRCITIPISATKVSAVQKILSGQTLKLWICVVTLILNTEIQSFCKMLQRTMLYHQTKFGSKKATTKNKTNKQTKQTTTTTTTKKGRKKRKTKDGQFRICRRKPCLDL